MILMSDSKLRNERAKLYITNKLTLASTKKETHFTTLSKYDEVSAVLQDLIETNTRGFKGLVATALTGMHLDSNYDPINDFYGCSPRSIFEQGIFFAFQDYQDKIPSGKSDPLNVAKTANKLDRNWAKGRRPETAALAVVNFLEEIVSNTAERDLLVDFYFFRLLRHAKSVAAISITIPESDDLSQQEIGHRLVQFTYQYPESGTIPQYIFSLLFNAIYEHSSHTVVGGEESVFSTNTTSKKAADIWIEENGQPINLYEITVKKVDIKRLDDSINALNDMDMLSSNIHFICRLPEDTNTLDELVNGTYIYKGKRFNFIDMRSFMLSLVALLKTEQLKNIIDELTSFIEAVERPVTTKAGWNKIFNE